jgi:glycosyltransferase involved in cell wall biosynthesis
VATLRSGRESIVNLVHLTASTFHGGPERQMLGLGRGLAEHARSTYVSFPEDGRCRAFLAAARQEGFEDIALEHDTPRFRSCIAEIAGVLQSTGANVLLCHGYKANILGRPAARRAGIPAVAVSRGWTGESWRVRLYERLDRFHLRFMDHVIAVSEAQAEKVRRAGVRASRVRVIHNAIDPERFVDPDPRYRTKLEKFFRTPKSHILAAAGRLSPEKGFDVFLGAAARVLEAQPDVGFVLFGHGAMKQLLQQQVTFLGLGGSVVLAGFRNDLDRFISQLDLFVLPSYTEGLPNVVLEACAAGVPVVATEVGGTPEVIADGVSGFLVPPGDPDALAGKILEALEDEERLREVGFMGRERVLEQFTFPAQVAEYLRLFEALGAVPAKVKESPMLKEIAPEPTCER